MKTNILNKTTPLAKEASTSYLFAFTLAEVLITLGIIGVVAALSIPTLMNNINDAQFKTSYKKAFSIASQAWISAVADGNIMSRPTWIDDDSRIANFSAFKSYFKVTKDCNNDNNIECWAAGEYFYVSNPEASAPAFVDSSGMAWSINAKTGRGAEIHVDTNGLKKPNKYGQDRFYFYPVAAESSPGAFVETGMPIKIMPQIDYLSKNTSKCPSGDVHPCYFTKWLYD